MKYLSSLLLLALLLPAMASGKFDEMKISIRKAEKQLLAPVAASCYAWYYNGELMAETSKAVTINKSGSYEVKALTEDGDVIFEDAIAVVVDSEGAIYRIFLIGDSTMQRWSLPQAGWGEFFQYFFNSDNVQVINAGRSGRSSRSYYNDTGCSPSYLCWPDVQPQLQSGDYVVIQFGINDRSVTCRDGSNRCTDPAASWENEFATGSTTPSFKWYLKKYVDETKAKGAVPILCTTIRRADLGGYGDYAQATRDLAHEFNIPLIDVDSLEKIAWDAAGATYADLYWHYPDVVHLSEMGAIKTAAIAAEGLKLNAGNADVDKLLANMTPTYDINITTNYPNDVMISRSEKLPEGLFYTLDAQYDAQKLAWAGWFDGDNNRVTYNIPYRFKVEANDYTFLAKFDTDFSKYDCNNDYDGGGLTDECGACVGGTQIYKLPCTYDFDTQELFTISTFDGGLCIDGQSAPKQQLCTKTEDQLWILKPTTDNKHFIIQSAGTGNNLTGTLSIGAIINGKKDESIEWRIEHVEGDLYQFSPKDLTDGVLATLGSSPKEGSRMSIAARKGADNQHFILKIYKEILGTDAPTVGLIYPNPTNGDAVKIQNPEGIYQEVKLYDLEGKVVFQSALELGINQLEMPKQLKGLFVVELIGEGRLDKQKLMIQ